MCEYRVVIMLIAAFGCKFEDELWVCLSGFFIFMNFTATFECILCEKMTNWIFYLWTVIGLK